MTTEERIARVQKMIGAPSCCADLKAAGQAYIDAVGTEKEAEAQEALVAELKEDVTSIDGLIAFAGSETGKQVFGEEGAGAMLIAAKNAKAAGEDTCLCDACQAGKVLLKEFS